MPRTDTSSPAGGGRPGRPFDPSRAVVSARGPLAGSRAPRRQLRHGEGDRSRYVLTVAVSLAAGAWPPPLYDQWSLLLAEALREDVPGVLISMFPTRVTA